MNSKTLEVTYNILYNSSIFDPEEELQVACWNDSDKIFIDHMDDFFHVNAVNDIKNRDLKYQVNVVATMLGRAKKHPSQTEEMREAIVVFNKWINDYKKNKNT